MADEIDVTQELGEIIYNLIDKQVYVVQEVVEIIYDGPYVHSFGPKVQELG